MAVRNFNEAEKQKLIQIISQGSQVLGEVEDLRSGLKDTVKAIAFFDQIRKRGYATMHPDYSRIEYRHSMTSLAVPIMSDNKVFASINVLYLKKALTEEQAVKTMLKPLQATAKQIAQELERRSEK